MTYGRSVRVEVTACHAILQIFWLVGRGSDDDYGVPLFTVFAGGDLRVSMLERRDLKVRHSCENHGAEDAQPMFDVASKGIVKKIAAITTPAR